MSAWAQTVRLTPSQYRALHGLADTRGLSDYAMLARVVEAGFIAMLHGSDKDADFAATAHEIGAISERLAEAERVLDRTLFTACAAYAYARHAALGTKTSDEAIAGEVRAAFERQRSLALDDRA
jgi:hypothetical protein